jgi:hypothetical protein
MLFRNQDDATEVQSSTGRHSKDEEVMPSNTG